MDSPFTIRTPANVAEPRQGHLLLGAATGAAIALIALDIQFIIGTGPAWVRPEADFNVYVVAWHYFLSDTWRLPLFEVPGMGYPEGSNVVFSDVLPLTALMTKASHSLAGITVVER